jgi:mono/diheme cytochrome c family protein
LFHRSDTWRGDGVTNLHCYYACLLGGLVLSAPLLAEADETLVAEESEYQTNCGICHLQDGAGVPGAFPPLNERLGHWAKTENGRTYLVKVVTQGLSGVMVVEGQQYMGAMPAIGMQLEPEQLAGLLNYTLGKFASTVNSTPYTAQEIEKQRAIKVSNAMDLRPRESY